ncbi:hypothetical protein P152DRAFT_445379 [Eremomyces bilateralis CBS 781.70]|uniref:DUF7905 domain-containing protein n=1 Tax=Eremomyces bilateralis CBS 781.70 TaxID=1392243 RepID=A0A6G1GGT9_9PEZI|nr:uncharacterized protein P152DRAFT_445379 [Eremomyces bilateralis CBS 781.70]KAF1817263.1 hypothetical protein P152DRAFT_445379 [Eremomyces bilateralis CBS 781.70]
MGDSNQFAVLQESSPSRTNKDEEPDLMSFSDDEESPSSEAAKANGVAQLPIQETAPKVVLPSDLPQIEYQVGLITVGAKSDTVNRNGMSTTAKVETSSLKQLEVAPTRPNPPIMPPHNSAHLPKPHGNGSKPTYSQVDDPNRKLHFTKKMEPIGGGLPRYTHVLSSGPPRPTRKGSRRPKIFSSLVTDPDNAGRRKWRKRERPCDEMKFPPGFDPGDQSHLPARYPRLDLADVARSCEVYMEPNLNIPNGHILLNFYGLPNDVRRAKAKIQVWLQAVPKELLGTKFARVRAEVTRFYGEQSILAQTSLEKYRRPPPPNVIFGMIAEIAWGRRDWRMEEVLGENLEALDPIRMDHKIYITKKWDAHGDPILCLYCEDSLGATEGMARIMAIDKQVDAREYEKPQIVLFKRVYLSEIVDTVAVRKFTTSTFCSTDWAGLTNEPPPVIGFACELEGKQLDSYALTARQEMLPPLGPSNEEAKLVEIDKLAPGSILLGVSDNDERNLQLLEAITIPTLELLNYFRGNLKMRVRVGQFLVDAVRTDKKNNPVTKYSLEEFEQLINERNADDVGNFNSEVTEHLGDRKLERHILGRLQRSSAILSPYDLLTDDLNSMRPRYSATFLFKFQETKKSYSTYRLETSYAADLQPMEGGQASSRGTWSKFFANEDGPTQMLQFCFADLTGRGLSYHFGIEGTHSLHESQVPSRLLDFAKTIRFHPEVAGVHWMNGKRFVTFGDERSLAMSKLPLIEFVQRRHWLFRIKGTECVIDLSYVQTAELSEPVAGSKAEAKIVDTPRSGWALNMFYENWDDLLGYNGTLAIGNKTLWRPEEWQFFGANAPRWKAYLQGTFFKELMQNMELLENIVLGQCQGHGYQHLIGNYAGGDFAPNHDVDFPDYNVAASSHYDSGDPTSDFDRDTSAGYDADTPANHNKESG